MSNENRMIDVMLKLTPAEAQALAQFVKRTGHSDAREKAASDNEAYLMMDGINEVLKALSEAGYAPR